MYKTKRMVQVHQNHQKLKVNIKNRSSLQWTSRMYQLVVQASNGANSDRCYRDIAARRRWHLKRTLRYDRFNTLVASEWVVRWQNQGFKYDNTPVSKAIKNFFKAIDVDVIIAKINKYKDAVRYFNGQLYCYFGGTWNKNTLAEVIGLYTLYYQWTGNKYRELCGLALEAVIANKINFKRVRSQAELDAAGLACQMAGLDVYGKSDR